jgi:hypothetical protein
MIPKYIRVIGFILYCLFWIGIAYLFVGCANTSYHNVPSGMAEDSQDFNQSNTIRAKIIKFEY